MYKALYREYRPKTFSEVKGQYPIVQTLTNQLKRKRLGHAYLFSGTRGTGKTSVAKLLAKAVNCENLSPDGEPCNECNNCKAVMIGNSPNVFEIDAASNNGVDNVREIRDNVLYKPIDAKYKIYIIDEVHMLSNGAFNALLKTLEEPPEHVIFILATTETQKVPATIFSRCQHYAFRRVQIDEITAALWEILKKENITAEDKAVKYIAKAGDGSLRDALSIMEQCLAYENTLTYAGTLKTLGTTDVTTIRNLCWYLAKGAKLKALDIIGAVAAAGIDYNRFTEDLIWYLRNIMLLKASGTAEGLELSHTQIDDLLKVEKEMDMCSISRDIKIFTELLNSLKYANQKRVLLELAVIKATTPEMGVDVESLLVRIKALEGALQTIIKDKANDESAPSSVK